MTSAAAPLSVSSAQREVLERVTRSSSAAHREVMRARVLLDAADGGAPALVRNEASGSPRHAFSR